MLSGAAEHHSGVPQHPRGVGEPLASAGKPTSPGPVTGATVRPMPDSTNTSQPAGVELLRLALGQVQSAIAAVVEELAYVTPDRWTGTVARARALADLAREAAAIAGDSLHAVAGAAPPVPDLRPEDSATGSGRHRREQTELLTDQGGGVVRRAAGPCCGGFLSGGAGGRRLDR